MKCPFAVWRGPIPNRTQNGMADHRGLVLHIMQGTLSGTDSWFKNPRAQASAHFGIDQSGTIYQWVDTQDKAWAEAAGNPYWISVELAGYSGKPATDAQLTSIAHLFAWLRSVYPNIPAQVCDSPSGKGLGWHGMGGQAWGGHLDCPGAPIKAQRQEILRRLPGHQPAPTSPGGFNVATLATIQHGDSTKLVRCLQAVLVDVWGKGEVTVNGVFDDVTKQAVEEIQTFFKMTVDGIVGPNTWGVLLTL